MRAREFTINVPIKINIDGSDDEPEIGVGTEEPIPQQHQVDSLELDFNDDDDGQLDQNPVFVPPLQQQIEMQKSAQGKKSPYIKDLLKNQTDVGDETDNAQPVGALKKKFKRQ
jgi:hypothetical protein